MNLIPSGRGTGSGRDTKFFGRLCAHLVGNPPSIFLATPLMSHCVHLHTQYSTLCPHSDWLEEPSPLNDLVHCLFCLTPHTGMDSNLTYMRDTHGFDFSSLCTGLGLDYYGQVKMVNFVRRKKVSSLVRCLLLWLIASIV